MLYSSLHVLMIYVDTRVNIFVNKDFSIKQSGALYTFLVDQLKIKDVNLY